MQTVTNQQHLEIASAELSADEDGQRHETDDHEFHKTGFISTAVSIIKTIMGVGIISLPYAMSHLGYLLGLILMIIGIFLSQFSSILLLRSKNLSKHSNFITISKHIFSCKAVHLLCSFLIVLNNTGVCMIELMIFRDSFRLILHSYNQTEDEEIFYLNRGFIVAMMAILELPLILVKKIEKLKLGAYLGILGIITFFICFVIIFIQRIGQSSGQCSKDILAFETEWTRVTEVLPIFIFAFGYHINQFRILKGMENPTDNSFLKTSFLALTFCGLVYYLIGFLGYCLFGTQIEGNFLLMFKRDQTEESLFLLLNIGFFLCVFFSFPYLFIGAKTSFLAIVKAIRAYCERKQESQLQSHSSCQDGSHEHHSQIDIPQNMRTNEAVLTTPENQLKNQHPFQQNSLQLKPSQQSNIKLYYISSIILYLIIVLTAIFVEDITNVFNIIGAFASTGTSLTFPSLFYFVLIQVKQQERKTIYYTSIVLFVFSLVFCILTIVSFYV